MLSPFLTFLAAGILPQFTTCSHPHLVGDACQTRLQSCEPGLCTGTDAAVLSYRNRATLPLSGFNSGWSLIFIGCTGLTSP